MDVMTRPRPPYLHRVTTRHGKMVWYVRPSVGARKRIRLRSEFGTEEFRAEYEAALSGAPLQTKGAPPSGTLAWLIERYREVGAWTTLSPATRRQRENIFKHVLENAGEKSIASIKTADIMAGIERRSKTPAQARNFLKTMRGLFKWAARAKHIKDDPTVGVENPYKSKGQGFIAWTESDVLAYERRWPIGTRQRIWLDVLLYTGLRRGDAVRFGRQHVKDGLGTIKTEKSNFEVSVTLPILPVLQATLTAGPCGDLTFIAGEGGRPLTKESFGNLFRAACRAAGVAGSAHGVRKIAATRAAENGATVAQLEAIFGWKGGRMASLYTESADRRRLSIEAMGKLANSERTSMDAPLHKVRPPGRKSK
jgi:integrase